jgi:hypothetical protein
LHHDDDPLVRSVQLAKELHGVGHVHVPGRGNELGRIGLAELDELAELLVEAQRPQRVVPRDEVLARVGAGPQRVEPHQQPGERRGGGVPLRRAQLGVPARGDAVVRRRIRAGRLDRRVRQRHLLGRVLGQVIPDAGQRR